MIIRYWSHRSWNDTEYVSMRQEDINHILIQLWRWLAEMAEREKRPQLDQHNQECLQLWHTRNPHLGRARSGTHYRLNSLASMVGGLCNNLVFGSQRDFTVRQLQDLEYISDCMSVINQAYEPIRFVRV